ncbi:MAG TPA: ATP-binding protein [Nitrospirota bacterium]|nr:ATP-binding protein [Nitrospirota bacterium]
MKYNTIKARLAVKTLQLGLLFFLLSFGIYQILRLVSPFFALFVSCVFFSVCIFLAAYISNAQELWTFKKLAEGGRKGEDSWVDLPEGTALPDEVGEVRDVLIALRNTMDEAILSQRRFLADASHEMRSPITIMKGNIEIALRRERDLDEYRHVLRSNLEEINRLEFLLKDLMFLARTDASELVMNMAPVRLEEVLEVVYVGLKPLSAQREIEMHLLLSEDDECVIEGDSDRLGQLFVNLVENALRYTPAGGRVDIEVGKVAGISKVSVTDTGIGIPESEIPRIFDRFYRVDKARSRESGGTGLGLCICKWIVDAHRGDISIESKEGVGTKVTVMFI